MTENQTRKNQYRMLSLNIAYWRKYRGLTQEALAERVGISRSYIAAIEAPALEDKVPSLDCLLNIAQALDIPPAKLLEFNDTPFISKIAD